MRGQSLHCALGRIATAVLSRPSPPTPMPLHSIMLYFDPFGDNMKRAHNFLKWVSPSERDLSVTDNFLQETICEFLSMISLIVPKIDFTTLMKAVH